MTGVTTVTCRKCGEDRTWDKTRKLWRDCRNGCSQITATIPDSSELVYTRGESADGVPVHGGAIHRKATCDD